jgi:hypothetical protein
MTDRADELKLLLQDAAAARGMRVTVDGRVSETDAAALLGFGHPYLRRLRDEGRGPVWLPIGAGDRSRLSYNLAALAEWIAEAELTALNRHQLTRQPRRSA